MHRYAVPCAALLLVGVIAARGQNFTISACDEHGSHRDWIGQRAQACEIRSAVIPLNGDQLQVAAKNGGISIIGEDRRDVALEVKVTAGATTEGEAQTLLHQIRIVTAGTIQAMGPAGEQSDSSHWSASYKLRVPRHVVANLHAENGGIEVSDVEGAVTAETRNGGLSLRGAAGTVHATTVNGGVTVALAGDRVHGDGITAKTENGGISLRVPEQFAAHLIATTVNGGVNIGLPGSFRRGDRKGVDTDLNGGGPTVRLETTNGGISVTKL